MSLSVIFENFGGLYLQLVFIFMLKCKNFGRSIFRKEKFEFFQRNLNCIASKGGYLECK